tara:strand:+ start:238 stop:462 length:225 start_codon:yes stop_codon:yes gene_type:complete
MSLLSFFFITIVGLIICYFVFDFTSFKKGEVIVTPVCGLLLGIHYNKDYLDDNSVEHTWQFSVFVFIITFKWTI